MIRHDGGGAFHDRNPIRICRTGDKDRTIDETADILRALDQAHAAGYDSIADAKSREKRLTF